MNGEQAATDIKREAKALSMSFFSTIKSIVFFFVAGVAVNIWKGAIFQNTDPDNTLLGACILLYAVYLTMVRFIYNKRMNGLGESVTSLPDKMNQCKKAFNLFIALVEIPAVIGIICFLLTGKFLILLVPLMAIVQMILKRPTEAKLEDLLGADTYLTNKRS